MFKSDLRIVPKTEWKKLSVETAGIDPEFLDGFIGVEELTDYELAYEKPRKLKEKLPQLQRVNRKRNLCLEYEEEYQPRKKSAKVKTPSEVKAKTKPKKKKRSKVIKSKCDNCSVDNIEKNEVETNEDDCEVENVATNDDGNGIQDAVTNEDECDVKDVTVSEKLNEDFVNGWLNYFVPDQVLRALSELGFLAPTQIQALTLPAAIRDHRDILGAAETGSGKTLAFGIPIIHHILRDKAVEKEDSDDLNRTGKFRCLIMTPTRELAIQIKNHLVAAAKYTDITICVVVGGMASEKQFRLLKREPDIVIATPGRLWELIQEEEPHVSKVRSIKYLVVDEADRMLEAGHFEELSKLLALINSDEAAKSARQTFIFSATLTFVHQLPRRVLNKKKKLKVDSTKKLNQFVKSIGIKDKPKIVDITQKSGTCETLTESRIHCTREEKDYFLYYLLAKYAGKTIVFCNSIDCVRRLSKLFTWLQLNPLPLHASMHQKQRLKNLERFSYGKGSCCLVATDVAARGLDIPNIEHVIHYQVPRTSESYIHRSGRTARATKEGISILLIDSSEQNLYQKICRNLNKGLKDLPMFPVDSSALKEVKLRVNLARQLDSIEHKQRRMRTQNNWIESMAKSLDMDLDDDDNNVLNDLGNEKKQAQEKRELRSLKQQLNNMLNKPLNSKHFVTRYPVSIDKPSLEKLKPAPDETAITVARKEKKFIEQLKSELKLVDKRKLRTKQNKKKKAKKQKYSKTK